MFTEENARITNSDQLLVANCCVKLNLTFGLPRVLELTVLSRKIRHISP